MSILLYPLTLLYRASIFLWNAYWRKKGPVAVDARVISVGGLTAGGSGKTTVAAYIASKLISKNKAVAVVARGYKKPNRGDTVLESSRVTDWREIGDEPFALARSVRGVKVYVSSNKTSAAIKASSDGNNYIIIDDGFQHRRLKRDVNIVCLDGERPYGNGMMLPSGLLREPATALLRADILLIVDPPPDHEDIKKELPGGLPVFEVHKKVCGLKTIDGRAAESGIKNCLGICGLGNPRSFRNSLEKEGYGIADFMQFTDHHVYSTTDIEKIAARFDKSGAECVITTLKDIVKLEKIWNYRIPLYYLEIEIEIDREEEFFKLLGL